MKKSLLILVAFLFMISVCAFDYVPKNSDSNPFGGKLGGKLGGKSNVSQTQDVEQTQNPEMREIKTLSEYFKYLPAEVHRHWTPYKADINYEIVVQFVIHRDGKISDTKIVGTNYPAANASVLKAVKSGAPYQPLPKSFNKDSVKAQVILDYNAKN